MGLPERGIVITQRAMLPRRELGRTGLSVSPIGLGTVKFGRTKGVRYPTPFELPDDAAAARLLALASDHGVNLLDTAPAYGESESRLGRLLAGWRDRWLICTKAGEEFDEQSGASTFDFSPEAITASVQRSLRRLGTDRVECVLLHSDSRDEWILRESGAWQALERLRERGLLIAAGISTKTPQGAVLAAEMCDVVMLTLNARERADLPAIAEANRSGAGVLVKKALASGHLAARPELGVDPVEQSLRFAIGTAGVSSVVIGTINPGHLLHNIHAAERSLPRA